MSTLMMMLTFAMATTGSSATHVRTTEPKILSIVDAGVAASATFRGLIAALDASDVIVYIEPKRSRQALGGYLAHTIVAQGNYRYLRIAVDVAGGERRLVALLAHELQHAVEVARTPDARDQEGLERLFRDLAVTFCCGSTTCSETQAAKDVESLVGEELKAHTRTSRSQLARSLPSDLNQDAGRR
jgi:hypothetical protein